MRVGGWVGGVGAVGWSVADAATMCVCYAVATPRLIQPPGYVWFEEFFFTNGRNGTPSTLVPRSVRTA